MLCHAKQGVHAGSCLAQVPTGQSHSAAHSLTPSVLLLDAYAHSDGTAQGHDAGRVGVELHRTKALCIEVILNLVVWLPPISCKIFGSRELILLP